MAMNLNLIPEALEIYKLLNPTLDKNIHTKFVGGCVRDVILEQEIKDIDLATVLLPNKIIEVLNQNNIKTKDSAINFGVVTAIINDIKFEITTLRQDLLPDGRYAKILFTDDWRLDANRRDFTINAIYCGWNNLIEKKIIYLDPFNGREDLINGKIKFISEPEISIKEDYVRALRYFRFFYAYSQHKHNARVLDFIFTSRESIKKLSNNRLKKELKKIILVKNSRQILEDANILDFFNFIYPGFGKILNLEENQAMLALQD